MRKVFVLLTVAVILVGCDGAQETTQPKSDLARTAEPREAISDPTWTPSPYEYYESDYPPTPDTFGGTAGIVSTADYICPSTILGTEIPGNVAPYHKVKIGTVFAPLTLITVIGYSPQGIPKGRYLVPSGPWISEDGTTAVLGGTVDGYCLFKKLPIFDEAVGALHIYASDLDILGPVGGGTTGPSPCDYTELLYDPSSSGGDTTTCLGGSGTSS